MSFNNDVWKDVIRWLMEEYDNDYDDVVGHAPTAPAAGAASATACAPTAGTIIPPSSSRRRWTEPLLLAQQLNRGMNALDGQNLFYIPLFVHSNTLRLPNIDHDNGNDSTDDDDDGMEEKGAVECNDETNSDDDYDKNDDDDGDLVQTTLLIFLFLRLNRRRNNLNMFHDCLLFHIEKSIQMIREQHRQPQRRSYDGRDGDDNEDDMERLVEHFLFGSHNNNNNNSDNFWEGLLPVLPSQVPSTTPSSSSSSFVMSRFLTPPFLALISNTNDDDDNDDDENDKSFVNICRKSLSSCVIVTLALYAREHQQEQLGETRVSWWDDHVEILNQNGVQPFCGMWETYCAKGLAAVKTTGVVQGSSGGREENKHGKDGVSTNNNLQDLSLGLFTAIKLGCSWQPILQALVRQKPNILTMLDPSKEHYNFPPFLVAASILMYVKHKSKVDESESDGMWEDWLHPQQGHRDQFWESWHFWNTTLAPYSRGKRWQKNAFCHHCHAHRFPVAVSDNIDKDNNYSPILFDDKVFGLETIYQLLRANPAVLEHILQ